MEECKSKKYISKKKAGNQPLTPPDACGRWWIQIEEVAMLLTSASHVSSSTEARQVSRTKQGSAPSGDVAPVSGIN